MFFPNQSLGFEGKVCVSGDWLNSSRSKTTMRHPSLNVASLFLRLLQRDPLRGLLLFTFVLGWLVLTCSSRVLAQTDVSFTSDVDSLKCGESTTLRWKADSNDRVFILGIGNVRPEGHQTLEPLRTTTYTLVAEGPAGLRTKSLTISMEACYKGDDDYPDDEKFEAQITNRRARSVVDFLTHTHKVLQDQMGLTVKSFQSSEGTYAFKTRISERRASTAEDHENRIGARRVSYLVEIRSAQSGTLEYTIKTFTMKKKVLKETWTVENDPGIRRAEANKVRELLDAN